MRRRPRPTRVFSLAAPLLLVALLGSPPPALPAVFGIELAGGYGTYAMHAVNDSLHTFNHELGTHFPDITGGGGGLVAVRMWPNDRLLLRLALESMQAVSEFSYVQSATEVGKLTYDTGPVATTLTGTWFFGPPQTLRFGFGAGVGWYSIVGKIKGGGTSFDLSGDAIGAHAQGEALLALSPRWSLGGQLGYRYARVGDTKLPDRSTSPALVTDFSGVILRIGIAHDWWPKR